MADPFEVRMRFTSQLQHLSASSSSATKAANYALRHAEFADDLHSCILEQLERNNLNLRANIMYFLPALCDAARGGSNGNNNTTTTTGGGGGVGGGGGGGGGGGAEGEVYVRMVERDILRIVDLVAPEDGSGAANVKVVRKVLALLEGRGVLQGLTVRELEECILGRDGGVGLGAGAGSSPLGGAAGEESLGGEGRGAAAAAAAAAGKVMMMNMSGRGTPVGVVRDKDGGGVGERVLASGGGRLDKRQIEQRIEEDRERHKRAREGIWAVGQSSMDLARDVEFEREWEEGSAVGSDDYRWAEEECEERRKHLEYDDY